MHVFFASDLHGSLPATEKVLDAFLQSGATQLVLLGDILNHGPRNSIPAGYNPAKVAEKLNQFAHCIIAVRGNCDSEVDQMLLDFPMLAEQAWILLPTGQRIMLTHGHLYHGDKKPRMNEGDIIAYGHTHIPLAHYDAQQHFVFNPGSTTFPKGGHVASYGMLVNETFSVHDFNHAVLLQATMSNVL